MTTHRRSARHTLTRTRSVIALASIALAVTLSATPSASADTTSDVSWTMRPATHGAPDKRSWIELDADPGAVLEEQAALTNQSTQAVTFSVTAADGYFTDTGRFNMLPSSEPSTGAGTWIDAPESVTVEPGATAIVPFTVTVPDDAEPGDHAAGIAASVTSVSSDADGTTLGVESRIGFRVMTRVNGAITPGIAVDNVDGIYQVSWNPLRPGAITVNAEVVNTGNVRLLLGGTIGAQGGSQPLIPEEAGAQELLPGDRRAVSTVIDGVWPLFSVPVDFALTPTVVTPSEEQIAMSPVSQSASVVAIPVPQLVVVLGVGLILIAVLAGRSRSRRRVEALVRAAKEEGRREASATDV